MTIVEDDSVKKCKCGTTDHKHTSSSRCKWNKKFDEKRKEGEQQALLDLVEIEEDINEEETEAMLKEIDNDEGRGEHDNFSYEEEEEDDE